MLKIFLEKIREKSIHIVGVTGAEGSNILRFLRKHGISNITAHDFIKKESLEKSFKLWHKGVGKDERNKLFSEFIRDLEDVKFYHERNYLKDILSADLIFLPQSWRLYKEVNSPLFIARERGIPFYSLTRLYLDQSSAKVIGVTGTVGKGSTANLLAKILEDSGKNVYFSGNETWMLQVADRLDEMKKDDFLVLEISHRQLQDGFTRSPKMIVFTNLYPNHLDEVSYQEYKDLKLSILRHQEEGSISVLNYDCHELKTIAQLLRSKVVYFSAKNKIMNIKNVQEIYDRFLNTDSVHYLDNILAASTAANLLSVPIEQIERSVSLTTPLPARLAYLAIISGIKFYDDIKSTTPWAALKAAEKLGPEMILICGGRTKGIDYQEFAKKINKLTKYVIVLKSELSDMLIKLLPRESLEIVSSLKEAVWKAFQKGERGDNVVVSPAAGFFYSDFIKGKKSLRKLIMELGSKHGGVTSPPPKGKE